MTPDPVRKSPLVRIMKGGVASGSVKSVVGSPRAPSYTLHVQLGTSARTTPAIAVATQSAASAMRSRRVEDEDKQGCAGQV